jgi:ribulose-5-phosphate 4-epimerase/fuculose-1-phosphate aldolase
VVVHDDVKKRIEDACWIGKKIFDRNKTSGSSANMSFRYGDHIYITASGTCFGRLDQDSFSITDLSGNLLEGNKPSKELPLHLTMYKKANSNVNAVIHVHSFYATLWSCLNHEGMENNVIPHYTPYLQMKLGNIVLIPFAQPGSRELFSVFDKSVGDGNGYLLAHHGPVVGAEDLMSAFFGLEELEESAHIAWELRHEKNIAQLPVLVR